MGKLFNAIMNDRLNRFLETNSLISDTQIGFKKGSRTSDHIPIINTIIKMNKKLKKDSYLCFIDFKKAFDSILHNILFLKISNYNISALFYKKIKSMYQLAFSNIQGKTS